jgi:transposase-like protein
VTYRSGIRVCRFDTRLGTLYLVIPKLHKGGYRTWPVMVGKEVNMRGMHQILAVEPMENESEETYRALFACLRDLKKVWLVVSDASAGLQAAIRKDFIGASSNTPERLNREISLRSRVVGIFPGIGSYLWLVITYLIECEEDWQSGRSYIKAESLARRQVLLTEAA